VSAPAQPAGPRRRGRVLRRVVVVLVVLIVLLGIAAVVADGALRSYAEDRVAADIESTLPEGVEGNVDVTIGGASLILQYLSGSFEQVHLSGRDLTVNGTPLEADIEATGVPADQSRPVDRAVGRFSIDESALTALIESSMAAPADVSLSRGAVEYSAPVRLLGLELTYDVTAKPKIDGDTVVFTPTGAELSAGSASFDVGDLLGSERLASLAFPVCAAQYLPEGTRLTDLDLEPGRATVTVEGSSLNLNGNALTTVGSCD
jgi:LmeA-like phospholipid-binding